MRNDYYNGEVIFMDSSKLGDMEGVVRMPQRGPALKSDSKSDSFTHYRNRSSSEPNINDSIKRSNEEQLAKVRS